MIDVFLSRPRARLAAALDRQLGRVTMYRLVTIVLVAIAGWAVLLSSVGQLFYTPLELAVSLAVAVLASYGANRLFALVWRVRPHSESAIITGLLLFFLFWPSTAGPDLAALAGAAVVANLSKYVLVVRGRHVFNPAALGAFAVGLSGLSGSVWWVATPLMLPVVLLGALAVLRRTRRTPIAAAFVVVALVPVTLTLLASGQPLGSALGTALGSYPVVFLAAFMLTEPLTLPPRLWQQLVEAVVVGLLFAAPFHLAAGPLTLSTSPELALLVGNLLALAFAGRGAGTLTLVASRDLTPTVRELTLRPDRTVPFRPGQFVELTLPHAHADARGTRRTFSLSGAPGADLTVAVKFPAEPSSYKRALRELAPGARLRATALGGDFLLPSDPAEPLLLVAGGIGITPFASQLAALTAAGEHRDVVVLYAVSSAAECAYADVLTASGARVVVLSLDDPEALPPGWEHLRADRLTPELLAQTVRDTPRRTAYLSGPPQMVDSVRSVLGACGAGRVRTDVFFGY